MLKLRLLPKMLILILIPVLLGFSIVATLNFFLSKTVVNDILQEELSLIADRQQSEMFNISEILEELLKNSVKSPEYVEYLEELGKGTAEEETLRALVQMSCESMIKDYDFITSTTLIDTKGKILAFSDPKRIGQSRANRDYFKDALQGKRGKANVIATSTKKLTTMMGMPVKATNGEIIGVLTIGVDLTKISKATIDSTVIGKTGKCYLFDSGGMVLAYPNHQTVGEDYSHVGWVKNMIEKKNGYMEFVEDGFAKVGYFRSIPSVGWHILVSETQDEMNSQTNKMLETNLFIGLIAVALVCSVVFFMAKNFVTPLQASADYVAKVAAGQFSFSDDEQASVVIASNRPDEIGWLVKDILVMVGNLRKLFAESEEKTKVANAAAQAQVEMAKDLEAQREIEKAKQEMILAVAKEIEKVSLVIQQASEDLAHRIESSEDGADRQAALALEAAGAMGEMKSTVLDVARNASVASDVSLHTKRKAEEGMGIVNEAIASISLVESQAGILKDKMSELDNHAQAVSQVMSVISDIADQTNLLALNAAIEAARAGEAGRGFAVVADEVRKLAEKTMSSTVEVGQTITAIQKSTAESAQQVEKSVEYVEKASELAGRSGLSLTEILAMAEDSSSQVHDIASAAEEQSCTAEQINQSVSEVSGIANKTAEAMREAIQAVLGLNTQTEELGRLVEKMKQ